jgi:hypothetical protein
MLCEETVFNTRVPCRYPAKYMVIAPVGPRVVCGVHARQFLKKALIPLNLFGPNFDTSQLPDINGFLRSMNKLGVKVSVTGTEIVINVGNKERMNTGK